MKAKDYAWRYKENPSDMTLVRICNDMFLEVRIIAKERHVQLDAGMVSVFKEIDQKWRAFARLSGDPSIKPDGFKKYVIHAIPELERYLNV